MKKESRNRIRFLSPLFLVFVFAGCDISFNPKGDYTEKAVVYSILDPTKKTQFARVFRTYNVEGVDASQNTVDPQVRNASVLVFDERGQSYVFKDSLLKRDATDRYATDIVLYYSNQLATTSGVHYRLEVTIPGFGKSTAEVTVPEPFIIFVNGGRARAVLADSTNLCNCVQVSVFGGRGAKGQLTRFFVDFVVKKKGQKDVILRREVPLAQRRLADGSVVAVFPQPDRGTYMEFPLPIFLELVGDVLHTDPGAEITVGEATFISYALDPSLYNYYLIAHGFGDPFSVRLDSPDFSNIQNGVGVFGALAVDSLTLPIR